MKIPKLSCTFASTIEKTHEDNVSPFSTFPLDTLLRKSAKEAFYYRKATGSYQKEPENSNALKFLCQYYLNKGEFSKTITYAEYMKNIADKSKNPSLYLYSYLFQGQAQ